MKTRFGSFWHAVGSTALLVLAAASPAWAHGGHESALDAPAALHVLTHLFGSPVTWAVVALGAWLARRVWLPSSPDRLSPERADDQV